MLIYNKVYIYLYTGSKNCPKRNLNKPKIFIFCGFLQVQKVVQTEIRTKQQFLNALVPKDVLTLLVQVKTNENKYICLKHTNVSNLYNNSEFYLFWYILIKICLYNKDN